MSQQPQVSIITCGHRTESGIFDKHIDSVWSSPESAKEELQRIANRINMTQSDSRWRARHPIGQPDDLTVELLKDGSWECHMFYRILDKDLHSH